MDSGGCLKKRKKKNVHMVRTIRKVVVGSQFKKMAYPILDLMNLKK
jgi:hypothetical protein